MTASKDLLAKLHERVAEELLRRIDDEEATAADIGAAIKMLKDNGVTSIPAAGSKSGALAERLAERQRGGALPTAGDSPDSVDLRVAFEDSQFKIGGLQ